jgi:hypothetical protein
LTTTTSWSHTTWGSFHNAPVRQTNILASMSVDELTTRVTRVMWVFVQKQNSILQRQRTLLKLENAAKRLLLSVRKPWVIMTTAQKEYQTRVLTVIINVSQSLRGKLK